MQCDEIRVRVQGAVLWMAMAVMVSTRLWLGGQISAHRDSALIECLITRVKRCAAALGGAILFCTDGLVSYPKAIQKVFREPDRTGQSGRPRFVAWPNLLIAQVVKQDEEDRVVGIARKIYQGTKGAIATVIAQTQGYGEINTAFIERLNATFREHLASLVRRGRA